MKEAERFLSAFSPLPDGVVLPRRIREACEAESCLACRGDRLVLRLRRRSDGARLVLKIAPAGGSLPEEFSMLRRVFPLLPGSVPEPVDCFSEGGSDYLLRTFLPGETLYEYRERTGGCSAERCAQIGRQFCGLLEALHRLDPPVIHRDIKPENLLLLPDGGAGLLDFGTARQFKAGRDTDTRRLGTRATAAPEQYGFAQTDGRTDVYGLAMTLIWLLTGGYDRENLARVPWLPRRLRRALERASAFSPADRPATAAAFARSLSDRRPRWIPAALGAALAVCAVAAAALWPRTPEPVLTEPAASAQEPDLPEMEPAAPEPEPVTFSSACLEAAVRQALDRPSGEITAAQLADVERLAVVGENVFGPEVAFDYRIGCYLDNVYQAELPRGDITDGDLALLAQMPNLKELYLCRQDITDASVLADLPLTTLALCETEVADVSFLASLTDLETLYLGGNDAVDYGVLAGLTGLRTLILESYGFDGVMTVESLDFLDALDLRRLGLGLTVPADGDWTPLERQTSLEWLQLWNPTPAAVVSVNTLSGLRRLMIGDYYARDLTALTGLTGLEMLSLYKGGLESLRGMEELTRLTSLSMGYTAVTDLTPMAGLERLCYVQFLGMEIADYGPLATLPALQNVLVDQGQLAAVEAGCPGHDFWLEAN